VRLKVTDRGDPWASTHHRPARDDELEEPFSMAAVRRTTEARGRRTERAATHEVLPHTADAGFTATASDARALFQEAAIALAEIAADFAPGMEASIRHDVVVEADSLPSLAYTWLNELIALADIHHAAVVSTHVIGVDGPAAGEAAGNWTVRARVALRPYAAGGVLARSQPKSATYHGLVVRRIGACWMLRAYVDL
jgi:SHS2 domain-containing protein